MVLKFDKRQFIKNFGISIKLIKNNVFIINFHVVMRIRPYLIRRLAYQVYTLIKSLVYYGFYRILGDERKINYICTEWSKKKFMM